MDKAERLTDADLGDMIAALEQLHKAQAVWEFVVGRLTHRYNLESGDDIKTSGIIERSADSRETGNDQ